MRINYRPSYIMIDENGIVKGIGVFENYEDANRISRIVYGDNAFALEYKYLVQEGDIYKNGFFYNVNDDGTETLAEYIQSDEEKINTLDFTVTTISEELHPTIETETCTLDELKAFTLSNFGKVCSSKIYAGSDIETSKGVKHFSYKDDDQRNLKAAADLAAQTGLQIPYHADGEDCCLWDALDIVNAYGANELLKTYQTTYCNLMNGIIRTATDKAPILALNYGDDLPTDKMETIQVAMSQAKLVFNALLTKLGVTPSVTE